MAQLIVRNLEDDVRDKLRKRAEKHGRSMEEEVREILRSTVAEEGASPDKLGSWCTEHFSDHDFEIEIPEWRGFPAKPANFDE
jgi:plasmid stability protein